jgi:chromosome partitioning protein
MTLRSTDFESVASAIPPPRQYTYFELILLDIYLKINAYYISMARVISICNQKGGVGKTTTAVNLGAYLAIKGKRALLVDFDPQANASSALGNRIHETTHTVYHGILNEVEPYEVVKPSQIFNFHYVPAAPHLAGALVELVSIPGREYFLRKFLNRLRHGYDYIFIDLPPSLSLLALNGLMASDEVLIPVQAEYYSLEGIGQLLETIDLIRTNLNHDVRVAGALVTMSEKRERLSQEVERDLRAHFPHPVFRTVIPRNVSLAEAPSFAKPVILHKPNSSGALAYESLADEIIRQDLDPMRYVHGAMSRDFGNFNINV